MAKRFRLVCTAAALVPLTLLAAACSSSSTSSTPKAATPAAANAAGKSISETGSTILFPLFGAWQTAYSTANPSVTITSGSTGSGVGIADAAEGLVNIGASDAWLSASDLAKYPGLLNIPLTVSAILVNYNLPGVKSLNLNGTVLAEIYTGKITTWNDPAIAALNPGVSLPSTKIVTLHRADSSGATFLFASYLNAQDPSAVAVVECRHDHHLAVRARRAGRDRQRRHGDRMRLHQGLHRLHREQLPVQDHRRRPRHGMRWPTRRASTHSRPPAAILAALASFPAAPASGAESLINTSAPTGYAIINYEYAIVKKTQPSAAEASAIKAFLSWILTTGDTPKYLSATNGTPLPSATLPVSQSLVSSIGS